MTTDDYDDEDECNECNDWGPNPCANPEHYCSDGHHGCGGAIGDDTLQAIEQALGHADDDGDGKDRNEPGKRRMAFRVVRGGFNGGNGAAAYGRVIRRAVF